MPVSFRPRHLAVCVLGLGLAACTTVAQKPPPPPPVVTVPAPLAPHALTQNQPSFLNLPNIAAGHLPVRVGIILPFQAAANRALAAAMMNAAELALFDSGNRDIILMTADEGPSPAEAAAAAQKLIAQGAEIIVGPLFGPSVTAVAPIARDHGVPVLAFSTEKSVAGNGVYLLSFLPQNEVTRVVSYAAANGHHEMAAMVPQNQYGDVVAQAYSDAVKAAGADSVNIVRFVPNAGAVMAPSQTIVKSGADAVLIGWGGTVLRAIGPILAFGGMGPDKVKLLGTGLWDDPSTLREQSLAGGWFAAPDPDAAAAFDAKYKDAYGSAPPQLASLAYDAISLVALLAPGQPYHRFTAAALMDPNGFAGVDGIFRFDPDGTSERGLAVLEVEPDGFHVVSPAPTTFQKSGS